MFLGVWVFLLCLGMVSYSGPGAMRLAADVTHHLSRGLGFGYFWGVMGSQLSEEPITAHPEAPNNHQYTVLVLQAGWWLSPFL